MLRAKAQGEEEGHTERVCKVCGPWPAGKSCRPGLFFPLSSRTSFNHRHSVHPPPVPVSQLWLPDDTVSMTFLAFHLPFPEYQDGVAMEMSLAATCLANRLGGAAGMADFLLMVVPCPAIAWGVGFIFHANRAASPDSPPSAVPLAPKYGNRQREEFSNSQHFLLGGCMLGGKRSGHSLPSVVRPFVPCWTGTTGCGNTAPCITASQPAPGSADGKAKREEGKSLCPRKFALKCFNRQTPRRGQHPGATPRAAAATARETCPHQPINHAGLATSSEVVHPSDLSTASAGFPCVRQPSAAADPVCPARPPGRTSSGPASAA